MWRMAVSKRKASVPSDYAVGYGRPPKETQFTPGKSGNPNGRRKGSRSVGAILKDIIEQRIAVTENGKTRRMPALEVMLRRLRQRRHPGRWEGDEDVALIRRPIRGNGGVQDSTGRVAGRGSEDPRPISAGADAACRQQTVGGRAMPTDARIFEALLRNDFLAFIAKAFATLCPGQEFERSWHIEAIAYRLEQVRRGEIKRLIINMPPRIAQIDFDLSRFSGFRPRARSDAPLYLRQLFRGARQKAFQ